MKVNFINLDKKSFLERKLLFKIMPFEHSIFTLETKSFWFATPETWKDPFERRFIDNKYNIDEELKEFPWRNRVFCTCMSASYGSEAQWKAYREDGLVVAFKINRKALLKEIEKYAEANQVKVFIGKVEYQKTNDIKKDISCNSFLNQTEHSIKSLKNDDLKARLILLKRSAFEYENEIRIILVKDKNTEDKGISLPYKCENTDIIDTISFDPNIGDYTFQLLKDMLISKYKFSQRKTEKGVHSRVFRSQLYRKPKSLIIKL